MDAKDDFADDRTSAIKPAQLWRRGVLLHQAELSSRRCSRAQLHRRAQHVRAGACRLLFCQRRGRREGQLNLIFKKVCEKAKRFYEVTAFFQYAIADGIHRLLFASRTGPHEPPVRPVTGQLAFDFLNPLL